MSNLSFVDLKKDILKLEDDSPDFNSLGITSKSHFKLLKKLASNLNDEEWKQSFEDPHFELPAIKLTSREMEFLKGGIWGFIASAIQIGSNIAGADGSYVLNVGNKYKEYERAMLSGRIKA